jgi:hypothetical protein
VEDASLKNTQILTYCTSIDSCGGRIFKVHKFPFIVQALTDVEAASLIYSNYSLIVQALPAAEDASLKYTNSYLLYSIDKCGRRINK